MHPRRPGIFALTLRLLGRFLAALAILHPDPRVEARLSSALNGAHDVVLEASWDGLMDRLRGGSLDACLVDVDHPDRSVASGRITRLRKRFPDLAIVASVESGRVEGLFGLGGLGVDGVVFPSSVATRLRADFDAALSTCRARQVERCLSAVDLPRPGPSAVAWAVEHAGDDTSVERLATALGHSPRSLRDTLNDAGLPSPARMLLWGRLLLAGARLGDDGRRVEDVAFSLGYATSTSFARAMKVHTGLTPAEVSRRGGMRVVLEALTRRAGVAGVSRRRTHGSSGAGARMSRVSAVASAVLLAGCATFGGGGGVDRSEVDRILESPPMDQMHVGVLATDLRTGRTLVAHNAARKFVPASNQKILVTAAALSLLGPDFRFRTEIWGTGDRNGSTLHGNLVVVGSGDPSLSKRYWDSGTAALRALADSVRATGLERVTGATLVDASPWDSVTVGPTWEVADLRYGYASTGGLFAIDEGEVEVVVRGGPARGEPAELSWSPLGTDGFVRSNVRTAPPDSATRVRADYLPESRALVLDGIVGKGATDTLAFAIRDPLRQASAALARALDDAGVRTLGGWDVRWTAGEGLGGGCITGAVSECPGATLLAVLESPPLADVVAGILGPSQNWMTEQLVRALGARFGARGSWDEGIGVVESWLVGQVGVDPADLAPRDGSGLSAYNLVTPRAIVDVLRHMAAGPDAAAYRSALAEPGEKDTTLEDRLQGLEGRVFAKTGTISNVNSLSGYLVGRDGREIVFSILSNGSGLPSSRLRDSIDALVRALAG